MALVTFVAASQKAICREIRVKLYIYIPTRYNDAEFQSVVLKGGVSSLHFIYLV